MNATHYEYENNCISKVQVDGNGTRNTSDSVNATYEFYPDGKLKSISYPPLSDGSVLKSEYEYDGLSRLKTLTNTKGTTVLSSYSYTYDKNGNILTSTVTVENEQNTVSYTYDKLNRIATVSGTKGADSYYEYDYRRNRKVSFEEKDFLTEENAEFRYDENDKLLLANVGDDTTTGRFTQQDPAEDGYNWYVYGNQNPVMFVDYTGEESTLIAIGIALGTCATNGLISGGIYKWNGKPFGAGFINGFVSCLGTEVGVAIGAATGTPTGVYAGTIIGNFIGSAAGSLAEDLTYNKDKSAEEMAKSAAQSAAAGIIAGVASSYFKYAIDLANEAGSAAKTLMQYDERFGKALQIFFDELVTILGAQ